MKYFYSILFLILVTGCTKEEADPPLIGANSNLFTGTDLVVVPPYSYLVERQPHDSTINVRGDSSFYARYSAAGFPLPKEDNLTSRPEFQWNPTGLNFVVIGVFDEEPSVSSIGSFITNPERMIWTWNTGLGTGREGAVSFDNGRAVENGIIQNYLQPDGIQIRSKLYYWAVWAWDDQANKVIFSSKVIPFRVTTLN